MDIFLIIVGILLLITGIVGCILPGLPGVPFSYAALILLHLTDKVQYSWQTLVIWGVVTIVATALDYIVPAWGTKKYGGSKWGVWGSTIGLIVGLFCGPWGIILGPFIGAFLFEIIGGKNTDDAFRAGWGSFIGLLTGTILKLVCCGLMTWSFFAQLF